jgi:hypothetical protein
MLGAGAGVATGGVVVRVCAFRRFRSLNVRRTAERVLVASSATRRLD